MSLRDDNWDPVPATSRSVSLDPACIRYTQNSISSSFRNGKSLQLTFHHLLSGHLKIQSIPNIRVFVRDDIVYSIDNRRLWLFKKLKQQILVDVVDDHPRFDIEKKDTTTDGLNIIVRSFKVQDKTEKEKEESEGLSIAFQRTVLRWSIGDILNDSLFKLPVLPQIFESPGHYYQIHLPHVLEEVRAQIKSGMEKIAEVPHAEVMVTGCFKAVGEFWEVSAVVKRCEPEDLMLGKANDVIMIKEASGSEIIGHGITQHIQGDVDLRQMRFHAKSDYKNGQDLFVYYCANMTTEQRINTSLRKEKHTPFLKQLLEPHIYNHLEINDNTAPPLQRFEHINSKFNSAQQQAIASITAPISKESGNGMLLIQGPPGTGKTATIIASLGVLVSLHIRTLVCSASNHAVDEIGRKVANNGLVGADGALIRPFVVLLGNKDNMDLTGGLETIFIENMVQSMHIHNGRLMRIAMSIKEFFKPPEMLKLFKMSDKKTKPKSNSPISFFMERFISSWHDEVTAWLFDARSILLPEVYNKYKACVEELLYVLQKLLHSVRTPSSDIMVSLLNFLENGLPFAVSSVESPEVASFLTQWQILVKGANTICHLGSNHFSDLEDKIMEVASVVFCTVSTCGSHKMKATRRFAVGIVDEAGQCIEVETQLALNVIENRCVLVGDPQQLPSTVISRRSMSLHYGRSMIGRMMDCGHQSLLLNVQYRMHPDISAFPNTQFYNSMIQDSELVKQKAHAGKWHAHPSFPSYAFFDITGTEKRDAHTNSMFNLQEVNAVCHLVYSLLSSYSDLSHERISIITTYREQLRRIELQLETLFPGKQFEIATIDGFQGRENDIIIFSAVRSNDYNDLGFVKDFHRLNVAITRAKYSLWIIGNCATLRLSVSWRALIDDATLRNRLFSHEKHKIPVPDKVAISGAVQNFTSSVAQGRSLFESAAWSIILSNRSCGSIRTMLRKGYDVRPLFKRLLWLAQGNRPAAYSSRTTSQLAQEMIKEFRLNTGEIILWTVDIDRYYGKQILKVWEILLTSTAVTEAVQRIDVTLKSYSREYISMCKQILHDGKIVVPVYNLDMTSIPTHAEKIQPKANPTPSETTLVEDSFLLMKFFPLSSHLARMLAVGNDMEIPFQLSSEETELVKMPMSSLFILGRSGTGKTTVLVFRMWSIQQAYQNSLYSEIPLVGASENSSDRQVDSKMVKQLFVTASPKLCASIKEYYMRLYASVETEDNEISNKAPKKDDYDMLDEDDEATILASVPESLLQVTSAECPLIVTFSKILAMVNNSLPDPFLAKDRKAGSWSAEESAKQEVKASNSIMQNYLTMQDDNSFLKTTKKEVDSLRFAEVYYKHFDQRLTSIVDSATVFLQIMSFIKGSVESMGTLKGYLAQEAYLAYPAKKCPLALQLRVIVYQLFQQYELMKLETRDYDQCDYIFHVIRQLKANQVSKMVMFPKIDFVYIDEVQDLTQAQLLLFSYVCQNLKGFVFAGDTAQTIAKGVGFRFKDIRSLFYTAFSKESEAVPDVHHLTQNFRTHSGICSMASSVVGPMLYFFPESVDKLNKETALVAGNSPVFLKIQEFSEIFQLFDKDSKVGIEFGAEQAIIVRDQPTKAKLLKEITSGLVLTIYEAKGLEFKSVLLFNFWKDSPAKKVWRILYKYMADMNIGTPQLFPEFSPEKFSALCNELKQLYVGITRTRQDLIIFDEDEKTHQPMLDYWVALGYVRMAYTTTDPSIAGLGQKSDPVKWETEGKKYFSTRNYELALRCFENSNSKFYQLWTKASIARQEAKQLLNVNKTSEANSKFQKAAALFLEVQDMQLSDRRFSMFAANSYVKCKEWKAAADLFSAEGVFQKAADCYLIAGRYRDAAFDYEKADMLAQALECCISGLLFDEGKQMVINYQNRTPSISADMEEKIYKFLRTGALHFHSSHDNDKTLSFVHMLLPTSQRKKFLVRYGYVEELVKVELADGNFSAAGDIYYANGKYEEAASAFKKGNEVHKEALCLVQQAKSIRATTPPAGGATPTGSLANSINAPEFVPKSGKKKRKHKNKNKKQNSHNKNISSKNEVFVELLNDAKRLLAPLPPSLMAFEVDMMLAINGHGDMDSLVPIAREHNYIAYELDILLRILPTHIKDASYPMQHIIDEGKRAKKLGFELLGRLAPMGHTTPNATEMWQQVYMFFQVSPHPNPEMKVVQKRGDWLREGDIQQSVNKPGQLEVRREVFVIRAIAYLGRKLVTNMINIVDRKAHEATSTATERIDSIFVAFSLGMGILKILAMTHLQFQDTLKDLKLDLDNKMITYLQIFSFLYYPVERSIRHGYLHNKQHFASTPEARRIIVGVCFHLLFSPYHMLDGLCLSLLAETGHDLNFKIQNYRLQYPLLEYLLLRESNQHIAWCSLAGIDYLTNIISTNNVQGLGFPPSQVVWMLENLVVYNLAYLTNFNDLILPKSLVRDCMVDRENILSWCLRASRGAEKFLHLARLWDLLRKILTGSLSKWLRCFPYENPNRLPLIERLLQLMFLIRINCVDFSNSLSEFVGSFFSYYRVYEITLSAPWLDVMTTQRRSPHTALSCTKFVETMQRLGEPFVLVARFNTRYDQQKQWAWFIPKLVVVSQHQSNILHFADIAPVKEITKMQPVTPNSIAVPESKPNPITPNTTKDNTESNKTENKTESNKTSDDTSNKEIEEQEVSEEVQEKSDNFMDDRNAFNKVTNSIKYKMARWLRRSRHRLYNLSLHEEYKKEARGIMAQVPDVNEDYMDFYCNEVCILREDLLYVYESLNTILTKLKSLNVTGTEEVSWLDKGLDAVEEVQENLELLDIKHPHHKSFELEWLHKRVEESTNLKQKIEILKTTITSSPHLLKPQNG